MWEKKIFACALILVLAAVVTFPAAGPPGGESSTDTLDLSARESSILEAYGKLPLLFIENQGQVDEAVRYYAKASGQTVYFTEENIVFDLVRSGGAEADSTADRLVFSLDFLGANSQPAVEGCRKDSAVVNYFIGNDPEQWYADVPTYGEVVYRGIYPDIDLRLYGDGGMLRYDFIVNPGAKPEAIALAYDGIDSLAMMHGELVMGTALGDIVQSRPYIYQQIGDEVVEVEGGFRLGSHNAYGFQVAAYNNYYPLIIDPMLLDYSTYLGGEYGDFGIGIAVDSQGSAYVTGITASSSPGFPTTSGTYQTSNAGQQDAFVTKLAPNGRYLVYSTYLGGEADDRGRGIAVDSQGNAYVTGETSSYSPGFPTTPGAYERHNCGDIDVFITKLAPGGHALVYSTYLGGEDNDYGQSIAVDSEGNAYVTGYTDSVSSPGFPTTTGAFQRDYGGGSSDAFVTKLASTGQYLVYSTYLGGEHDDSGNGIAVGSQGHAYVTGHTVSDSPGFPTTPGAFQTDNAGIYDAFVARLAPDGDALVYSTYLGGEYWDYGEGIAVDSQGHAYVTGYTDSPSPGFPTTAGAFQTDNAGHNDAFVIRLAPDGDALVYSTYLGGEGHDLGFGIAVDSQGHAYVTGHTRSDSPGFPTTPGAFQTDNAGDRDAFVTKLASDGDALVYSTYLGGESEDDGNGIAVGSQGYAYVTGHTCSDSPGFPTTTLAFQTTSAGPCDAFVSKIGAPCDLTIAATAGGTVTTPDVGTYTYDKGTVVDLVATPYAGHRFANWTGDVGTIADDEDATTSITMNDDYSVTANFEEVPPSPGTCFIATAAYGTPMADEVQTLREFRDVYLLTNTLGQAFVDFYYKTSPPIAGFITNYPSLKPIVRAGLTPVVAVSTVLVNTSLAVNVVALGSLALVSVAVAIFLIRRQGRRLEHT